MMELEKLVTSSENTDPLSKVGIDVILDGFLATYRVTHTFRNVEREAIEAVFTFPLPYGAVLLGVDTKIAGKSLSSVAMACHDAENRYEDSVSSGDSAMLVEEVSPGLHGVNLGNLAPGESATLAFSFGQLVDWCDDGIALRIPTTIAPRHGHPHMHEHLVPTAAFDVVRHAELRILVRGGKGNWRLSSPTHVFAVSTEGADLLAQPEDGAVVMDRDIVIRLDGGRFKPSAVLARDGDRHLVVATFQPRLERHRPGGTRVFKIVIDCSGSMSGDSINQAREGLAAILKVLSPDDRFSITRFGSSVEQTSSGVVQATPEAVGKALEMTRLMDADLGGTEMREALIETFALPWRPELADEAAVLLITDGETWDDEGIISVARTSRHRVFTIGVGTASAEDLLRKLGEETGGSCEIVTPREGMAERVLRQFERMDARRLTGQVKWPEGSQDVCPQRMGPVFAGETIHAFAWFDRKPEGAVSFTATAGPDVVERQVLEQFQATSEEHARAVAAIAVHGLIGELKDRDRATELAVAHGLLSQYTDLIMVAERAEKLDGLPVLRKVPHMVAAGWHGMGSVQAQRGQLSPVSDAIVYSENLSEIAFLSRTTRPPKVTPEPMYAKKQRPTRADRFIQAFRELPGDLYMPDIDWLRRAGFSSDLCKALDAFAKGQVTTRDVAIAALYLMVTEAKSDRFPRDQCRLVRQELSRLESKIGDELVDLLEAIKAVAGRRQSWVSIVQGRTSD